MFFICKSSYDDYNKDKDSCIVKMCQCVGIMVAEKSISEKILLEKTHSLNVTPVLSICTAPCGLSHWLGVVVRGVARF